MNFGKVFAGQYTKGQRTFKKCRFWNFGGDINFKIKQRLMKIIMKHGFWRGVFECMYTTSQKNL